MPHESTQGLGLTFEDFGPNLSQSRRQMICSCSLLAVPIFFSSWPSFCQHFASHVVCSYPSVFI